MCLSVTGVLNACLTLKQKYHSLVQFHNFVTEVLSFSLASEREYQHGVEALRDVRRKTCLLGVFTAYSDNLTSQNEAFAEKIDIKVDALKPKEWVQHVV